MKLLNFSSKIKSITILILILIVSEAVAWKFGLKLIFKSIIYLINLDFRISFVWVFCIVVSSFHYFKVVQKVNSESNFLIKSSNEFLNLVSTFTTFSVVINSSLTLLSGIIMEFMGERKIFTNTNTLDFYTLIGSSIFPIIWVFTEIYKMTIKSIQFVEKSYNPEGEE